MTKTPPELASIAPGQIWQLREARATLCSVCGARTFVRDRDADGTRIVRTCGDAALPKTRYEHRMLAKLLAVYPRCS